MNRAGLDMLDADSVEQIRGRCIDDILPEEHRDAFKAMVEGVFRGEARTLEFKAVGLKGRPVWLYSHAVPLRNNHGEITSMLSATVDITERKKAENRIMESEERFRRAFESIGVGASMASLKGQFIRVNRSLCDMLGYSEKEMLSKTFSDVTHPEDVQVGLDAVINMVSGEVTHTVFEKRYVRKDGTLINVIISPALVRDSSGKPLHFVALFQDITERKRAEEALRESEEIYRTLFRVANDMILVADLETGIIIDANHKAEEVLGMPKSEIIGMNRENLHPAQGKAEYTRIFKKEPPAEGTVVKNLPVKRNDGGLIQMEVSAAVTTLKGRKVRIGIFRDVTERMKAEEQLRLSESRLSESQRVAKIGTWSVDMATEVLYWSDETFKRFDKDPETFVPTTEYFISRIHPDDREGIQNAIQDSITNNAPYHIQPRIINESGREWVLEGFGFVERDENGRPIRFAGTTQDITERREAEIRIMESLKEKEVLLREIHHRVKNNMAIISSLLQLQTRYSKDDNVIRLFRDSQNRISSMALVHEKLYQTKDFANINFREYVKELIGHLMSTYGKKDLDIGLLMDIDDIGLNIDTIIPCGLILNELVTNSLKYAFEGIEEPKISISFDRRDSHASLVYEDNGMGIPEHIEFPNSNTLGLRLVDMLAIQLKGSAKLDRSNGTRFIIDINPLA